MIGSTNNNVRGKEKKKNIYIYICVCVCGGGGGRGPRKDKTIVTNVFLGWKHFKPEEGGRPWRGGEETKYLLEIWVERMVFRERFEVVERRFLWKLTYYLCINDWQQLYQLHWWGNDSWIVRSQLSSSFYHL